MRHNRRLKIRLLCKVKFKLLGAVHKVRHAIFGQFLPPPPCHTSSHIPGPPESTSHISDPPISIRPSTKNPDISSLVKILFQLFAGVFVLGVCQRSLLPGRFCPGWFLSVLVPSEYICYIKKLNITLKFMFRMYNKKIYKCDVTCSLPLCHKLSHLLGPPPPSSVT